MKPWDALTEDQFVKSVEHLKTQLACGDAKAGFDLLTVLDPCNDAIPQEWRLRIGASESNCRQACVETFQLLQSAARGGDGESMHLIAQYYQSGMPPVSQDMEQFREWCERAVNAGYVFAANDLYSLHSDSSSAFYDARKAEHFLEAINRAGIRVVR